MRWQYSSIERGFTSLPEKAKGKAAASLSLHDNNHPIIFLLFNSNIVGKSQILQIWGAQEWQIWYRMYSINRPGRLVNFWALRVGAYSRLGAY